MLAAGEIGGKVPSVMTHFGGDKSEDKIVFFVINFKC